MGVRWLYDNKIYSHGTGYGIGTLERIRDYSLGKYWERGYYEGTTILWFNFGSALFLNSFAIIHNVDPTSGTIWIGYGYGTAAKDGTVWVPVLSGTSKKFFNVGSYQYWRIGITGRSVPTPRIYNDTIEYSDSSWTYEGGDANYPPPKSRIDELFFGKDTKFDEQPICPFERNIEYLAESQETPKGKRFGFHKSKKHSWHFDYAGIRSETKNNVLDLIGTTSGMKNPFWLSIADGETDIFIGKINQESFLFEEMGKNHWNAAFDVKEER